MERWRKLHGRRLDHEERSRKKAAREGHKASDDAQKLTGLRAKLYQQKRRHEKIQMKKQIKAHEERNVKSSAPNEPSTKPLPQYLLDRSNPTNAKALSSAIKNKRAEKAAKFSVPLPKVRGIAEEEMFKVVKTGKKTAKKSWKRMITKVCYSDPLMCSNLICEDVLILIPLSQLLLDQTSPEDLSNMSDSLDLWVYVTRRYVLSNALNLTEILIMPRQTSLTQSSV